LQQLAAACAQAHNCSADVEIIWRAPPLINHAREVEVAVAAAIDVAGQQAVDRDAAPLTAGEDFAELLKIRPGAFVLLGNGETHAEPPSGLHTPHFDFNDALIPIGIAYWAAVVSRELGRAKQI
jgi:metal-dependent amidase/aminoacylase/carboxypeptidase family protein